MVGRKLATTITVTRFNGVTMSEEISNAELGTMTDEQLGQWLRDLIILALRKSARQKAQTAEMRKSDSPSG